MKLIDEIISEQIAENNAIIDAQVDQVLDQIVTKTTGDGVTQPRTTTTEETIISPDGGVIQIKSTQTSYSTSLSSTKFLGGDDDNGDGEETDEEAEAIKQQMAAMM